MRTITISIVAAFLLAGCSDSTEGPDDELCGNHVLDPGE